MSGKSAQYYSPTLELIHNETIKKIDLIEALTVNIRANLEKVMPELVKEFRLNLLRHNIVQIRNLYNLSVAQILVNYYKFGAISTDGTTRDDYEEYRKIVNMENFNSKIELHLHSLEKILSIVENTIDTWPENKKKYKMSPNLSINQLKSFYKDAQNSLEQIRAINISIEVKYESSDICSCGGKMIAITGENELYCPDCTTVEQNMATVTIGPSEIQNGPAISTGSEGRRKYDNHKPNKHLKKCLNILLAKKIKKINEEDLKRIEYVVKRDNYNMAEMDCEDMREILQQLGLTSYNDYVPLILKIITGTGPPEFTFEELRVIIVKFNKIIELLPQITDTMGNISFYLYFIYKIVEKEFANEPEKLRLLDYIHLQARETVDKNDELLQKIAEIAQPEDDLVFQPTDITRPYRRKLEALKMGTRARK